MGILDGIDDYNRKTYGSSVESDGLLGGIDEYNQRIEQPEPTLQATPTTDTTEVVQVEPTKSEAETRRERINNLYEEKFKYYNDKLASDMSNVPEENRALIRQKLIDGAINLEKERFDTLSKIDANITKEQESAKVAKEVLSQPQGLERAGENIKLGFLGARRLTQGLAKIIADPFGGSKELEADIAERENYIAEKLDQLGYDKDAVLTPDMIGQLAAEFAVPVAKVKSVMGLAGIGGATAATGELGKGEDYATAAKVGVATTALGAIGGKLANKFFPEAGEVPTAFAKKVESLGKDEAKALNKVLDNLDDKAIRVMDENARDTIINDIIKNVKSTKEVGKDVLESMAKNKETARKIVKDAYAADDEIAKLSAKASVSNAMPQLEAKVMDAPDAYGDINKKIRSIVGKREKNVYELEETLRALKREQRAATGNDEYVIGLAIDDLSNLQSKLGGDDIYKNARKLSLEYNKNYSTIIKEGEEAAAGTMAGRFLKNKQKFNAGEKLYGKNIDPNLIGRAVKDLPQEDRYALAVDALVKGTVRDEIHTPQGVSQIIKNYNSINKEGLNELVGAKVGKQLKRDIDSLAAVEVAIKEANKFDGAIGEELMKIGVAASMFKLSPFLAIRSSATGLKSILGKVMNKGGKQQIVSRINQVQDKPLRRKMMKALSLSLAGITKEKVDKEFFRESKDTNKADDTLNYTTTTEPTVKRSEPTQSAVSPVQEEPKNVDKEVEKVKSLKPQEESKLNRGEGAWGRLIGSKRTANSTPANIQEFTKKLTKVESGGSYTAVNESTGAYGKYQFIPSTLKEYARKTGQTIEQAKTPSGQDKMFKKFTEDNKNRLKKMGIAPTELNLWIAHNQGVGGAGAILKAGKLTPRLKRNISANLPDGINPTIDNYLKYWSKKFNG